jgi:signal transduction histidine kinase
MSSIKLFLFLIFFTPLSLLHAQADSLLVSYQTAKTPKEKRAVLSELSYFYFVNRGNYEEGERYAQILFTDATKDADTLDLINAYRLLGIGKRLTGKFTMALDYFEKGLALARLSHQYENMVYIYNNMNHVHKALGNVETAFDCLEHALAASQKCDCPKAKVGVMAGLSVFYLNQLKDDERNLFWLREIEKYAPQLPEDNLLLCVNKVNLALAFYVKGQIDSVEYYIAKGLACSKHNQFTAGLIYSHDLACRSAFVQKNFQRAVAEGLKAYTLSQSSSDMRLRLITLNSLTSALLETDKKEARKYLIEIEGLLKQNESALGTTRDVANAYENLFKAYLTTDLQRAAVYLKKQKAVQDSISNQVIRNRGAVIAAQGGIALKESENKRLQLEQEKVQQRNRFLLVGLILTAIAAGNLIYLYLKLRHKNTRLNDLNAALTKSNTQMERFTNTLSHDALGYINHILNYATAGQEADDVQEGHYMALKTHRYATNLKKMAQNLIQFNKTGFVAQPETVVLSELVAEVSQDMNGDLAANNVTLNNLTAITTVQTDRELLKQVLRNLTHNAVKFRCPDVPPVLDIKAVEKENEVEVSVADNGIGIAPEQLSLVFNEFTKLNKQAEGSGLGLFISKQIVERLGGQIWVESTIGQGSTFYFTLPKVENTPPQ